MTARPFSQCRYSAFISFATLDDDGNNSWISCFTDELTKALPGRLRGIKNPGFFFSGDAPLVAGRLDPQLRDSIAESFAMFLFVHANYRLSPWCLKELEHFKSLFGDDGFLDRLYVIAMSEEEIVQLTRGDAWKRLCPFDDQIWLQFYADGQPGEPIAIYASQVLRRAVATDAFWGRFVPVLADLAKKIRASVDSEPRAPAYPTVAAQKPAPTPEEERLVRVYIEADPEQRKYSEALGREIATCWDRVVARLKIDPVLYLRPTGLPMTEIDQRPLLDDADGVVLLWSKKTPDAVAAQIKKVEPKLTGPTPAPGLIAYMRENADDQPAGASVGNWNVVRFGTGEDGAAQVDAGDIDTLEAFLTSILARKRR